VIDEGIAPPGNGDLAGQLPEDQDRKKAQQSTDQIREPHGRAGITGGESDENIYSCSHESAYSQSGRSEKTHGAFEADRHHLASEYFLKTLSHFPHP
jgi:hypothetical protein